METSEKTIGVLNDLIKINNDRVAGFEKAGEDLEDKDSGLRSVFSKLASDSRGYSAELSGLARQYGADADEGTSVSGSLHRAWLDIKSTFTGGDLESILNECHRGEDAIKDAYQSALEYNNELPFEVTQLISRQQQGIIEGHNLIKSLRDQSEAVDSSDENNSVEHNETTYTDTLQSDEWQNKESDYKPFASNERSEIENNQQDDLDENELALANEVPVTGGTNGEFNTPRNNNSSPVDVGEYRNQDPVEGQQRRVISQDSKLQEFFVNELKDLLWAERKLVDTLPKMKEAATVAPGLW